METTLSPIAHELLNYLITSNGAWEQKCAQALFNKPSYPLAGVSDRETLQCNFWQWEANLYGHESERPVGEASRLFTPDVEIPFARQISAAYQELRKAGLADERNSGYNDYFFFAI